MTIADYSHRFYQNRACKYFPCHQGVREEDFNCLFCYCPLYTLGKKCGGNCVYTEKGRKSCANCTFPHQKDNYDQLVARYKDIMAVVERMDREEL